MSNPIKLVCLDENGDNMFVVSTNTKGSTNASTGAVVLNGGGLSINSTAESVSASAGGALTVAGGAAFGGDIRVASDIYFSGNLYQNGSAFAGSGSSQWTTTSGNVSYTSGSVIVNSLSTSNVNVNTTSNNYNLGAFDGYFLDNTIVDSNFEIFLSEPIGNILRYTGSTQKTFDIRFVFTNVNMNYPYTIVEPLVEVIDSDLNVISTHASQSILNGTNPVIDTGFFSVTLQPNQRLRIISGALYYQITVSNVTFQYVTLALRPMATLSSNGNLSIANASTVSLLATNATIPQLVATNLVSTNSTFSNINFTGNLTVGSVFFNSLNSNTMITTTSSIYDLGAYNSWNIIIENEIVDSNFERSGYNDSIVYKGATQKTFNVRFVFTGVIPAEISETLTIRLFDSSYNEISIPVSIDISGGGNFDTGFVSVTFQPGNRLLINSDAPGPYGFTASNMTFQYVSSENSATLTSTGNLNLTGNLIATGNSNRIGNLFTTGGNVGIGSSSPSALLSLYAESETYNRLSSLYIKTKQAGIALDSTESTNGKNWNIWSTISNDSVGAGCLAFFDVASESYRMLINSSGNVGIGTNSPSARLDVSGNLRIASGNLIATGNSNTVGSLFTTGGNVGIGTTSPQYTLDVNGTFDVSNTNGVMLLNSAGNVGVGTTSPSSKLDVSGNLRITSGNLIATGNSNTVGSLFTTGGNVGIGTSSPSAKLSIVGGSSIGNIYINNSIDGGVIQFHDMHHSIWGRRGYGTGITDVLQIREYNDIEFWTGGLIQNQIRRMIVTGAGNVGIGTSSPSYTLDIIGTYRINGTNGVNLIISPNNGSFGTIECFTSDNTAKLPLCLNPYGGLVGIGTSSPSGSILHVNGFSSGSPGTSYRFTGNGPDGGTGTWNGVAISLRASHGIWAAEMFLTSDERVKKDIIDVNDNSALDILRQIEPKRYKYRDTVAKGDKEVWGFISQQIESVLDYAVDKQTEFIPNVYQSCTVANNQLTCVNPHGLTIDKPTKFKIYVVENDVELEKIVTVVSVVDQNSIQIDEQLSNETAFIYGQEVDDFRVLKKDAIFTISVAALQQVDRELQSTKTELASLKAFLQSKFPGEL